MSWCIYCGRIHIEQPLVCRTVKLTDILRSGFDAARHVVQEVTPIGQELRKTVTRLLPFNSGECRRLATGGGDAEDRTCIIRREQDRTIAIPCATQRVWGRRDRPHQSAVKIDPFEPAAREETNGPAVRRPERIE